MAVSSRYWQKTCDLKEYIKTRTLGEWKSLLRPNTSYIVGECKNIKSFKKTLDPDSDLDHSKI